jgi:hypothetical protein
MGVPIVQQVILWLGVFLAASIVLRGLQTRLVGRFSLFYGYMSVVLTVTLVQYITYTYFHGLYALVYWICEFASALVGCAIIFELYRQSLRPFPLLSAIANKVMLFVLALVVARILVGNTFKGTIDPQTIKVALERDLRITQAVFLCGLLLLTTYYSVHLGRNLKGLALGYGIFLGLNIVHLSIRANVGLSFESVWRALQPASFDIALCIWLAFLWSKDPALQQAPSPRLGEDYAQLVAATRKRMAQTEEQLIRIIRP